MNHYYAALHKPFGYLSQFVDQSQKKKPLLGSLANFPEGTMAVGRLDAKSEGLLLLTTDGAWSNLIRSKKVEKEYWVEVGGIPSKREMDALRNGLNISLEGVAYQTMPCEVEKIKPPDCDYLEVKEMRKAQHGPSSWLKIIIKEGKNRQIRRMTAAIGYPTLRLIRMRIGQLTLDPLKAGEVRLVNQQFN